MATFRVKPLPESEQTSSKQWQLQKSGRRIATGFRKSGMVQKAEQKAKDGDILKTETKSGSVSTKEIERTSGGRLL